MINEGTVLILGAGSNCEYGFPASRQLRLQTIDALGAGNLRNIVLEAIGWNHESEMSELHTKLMQTPLSVDAFLEQNPRLLVAGKGAMAVALIRREVLQALLPSQPQHHWYEYLFQQIGRTPQEFRENANRLAIVTFNYDRSLECFMHSSLTSSFPEHGESLYGQLRILHVYGQLGYLDVPTSANLEAAHTRAYTHHNFTARDIKACVDMIKIMPERSEESAEFQEAHRIIRQARVVAFLGFGYDTINLERLRVDNLYSGTRALLGSAYGLEGDETRRVKDVFQHKIELGRPDEDVLLFLRRYNIFG